MNGWLNAPECDRFKTELRFLAKEPTSDNMSIRHKYLKDIVYGSVDGIITTFAVVSGVMGASLSAGIVIVLGFANLLADGISMAIGNYLSTKSESEKMERKKEEHRLQIEINPKNQVKALEKVLADKGLGEKAVKRIAEEIAADKKAWGNVLVADQFGDYGSLNPLKTASATFLAFIAAGLIPLLAFIINLVFPSFRYNAFGTSIILTACALFIVGIFKAAVTEKNRFYSGLETLLIGGIAATAAFAVGFFLKWVVG